MFPFRIGWTSLVHAVVVLVVVGGIGARHVHALGLILNGYRLLDHSLQRFGESRVSSLHAQTRRVGWGGVRWERVVHSLLQVACCAHPFPIVRC
eukprot:3019614-Amphidinium_carterae.1